MTADIDASRRVPDHQPVLNQDQPFDAWAHLDPGVFLDMNPSIVSLESGETTVVFCRYPVPPVPGTGSIWSVPVNAEARPQGRPTLLIGDGIDPRVIRIGFRIFVFYALIERNDDSVIDGSCVVLAEFTAEAGLWTCVSVFKLPKAPITGHQSPDAQSNWEKNWVPFAIDAGHIGLIYSHEPWDVLTLNVEDAARPRLEAVDRSPALGWGYGTIRGGTPPLQYDEHHLISFFHAAQVCGSRRVYTAGACVFLATAPYTPVLQTHTPLLMAPYKSVATRFGWGFAGSVVFPGGAQRIADGYRLICGLDDGEIATFVVPHAALEARLVPTQAESSCTLHDYRGRDYADAPMQELLYVPGPRSTIPDLAIITFIKALVGKARTFVDIGAGFGAFSMALAPRFDRVVAFEPAVPAFRWLDRNRALNDYRNIACHQTTCGQTHFADNPLDGYGFVDVELLKIERSGHEADVLRGASKTIAACRPVILIKAVRDSHPALQATMDAMDYTTEALFPLSPEWVLCLPVESRTRFSWFL